MRELGLVVKITKEIEPVLERVARFGFPTCQISTYVPEVYTNENAERINAFCRNNRIRVSQLWAGWPGKCEWDFVGGPETVGLVPLAYRKERCEIVKKASDFAVRIGVDSVATHAGFIPENPRDPLYARLVEDLRDVVRYCGNNGQSFCFETGQETPVTLLRTIQDIGLPNVGVNLDPANLVMYGKGNAVDSLKVLGRYVKAVHIKDGLYPVDGKELGREVPMGRGDVHMPELLKALETVGYQGPYTIEIELDRRVAEMSGEDAVKQAKEYLESYLRQ